MVAKENTIEQFLGIALVIKKPATPVEAVGNIAVSSYAKATVLNADEPLGHVAGNRVRVADPKKSGKRK